jgi:hypothetical protein
MPLPPPPPMPAREQQFQDELAKMQAQVQKALSLAAGADAQVRNASQAKEQAESATQQLADQKEQMQQEFDRQKAAFEFSALQQLEQEHKRMQAELEEARQASYKHHAKAAQVEIQAVQRNQSGLQAELDTIKVAKAREEEQRREEIERAMESLPKRRRSGMHGSDGYHPVPPYVGAGQGGSQVSRDSLSQFNGNASTGGMSQMSVNSSVYNEN